MPPFGPGAQKLLVPLIAGAVVVGGGALYIGKAQESTRYQQQLAVARRDLERLTAERQSLSERLQEFEAERDRTEEQVRSMREQLSSATGELERSRLSLQEFESRFQRLNQERGQLQTQLASLITERDTAKSKLTELEDERADMQRSVARMRERLTLLDRDYQQMAQRLAEVESRPNSSLKVASSSEPGYGLAPGAGAGGAPDGDAARGPAIAGAVELPPIIVRKDQAGMASPVRGRILEVNEPHNFLVLDKGSQDGVRVGMQFDIIRGSGSVGRVSVVRVRPGLAACDIVRAKTGGPIQVGDSAVQSGP